MGRVFVLLLLVASSAIGQEQQEELVLVGRVTKIVDGDTIDVKLDSGAIRVRFDSIDAPERAQPWGREATEALSRLLGGVGGEVELSVSEQDRYDRLVATVYFGGVNVNQWLVTGGHAWAYGAYLNDKEMVELEGEARKARRVDRQRYHRGNGGADIERRMRTSTTVTTSSREGRMLPRRLSCAAPSAIAPTWRAATRPDSSWRHAACRGWTVIATAYRAKRFAADDRQSGSPKPANTVPLGRRQRGGDAAPFTSR